MTTNMRGLKKGIAYMRRINLAKITTFAAALALVAAGSAFAQQPAAKPAAKPAPKTTAPATAAPKTPAKPETKAMDMAHETMAAGNWYLVMSPHTDKQCLATLDEVGAEGAGTLAKWDWGCKSGDHTGYLRVHAASAKEALMNVPADLRAQAKAVAIGKFTEADLKSMHATMTKH